MGIFKLTHYRDSRWSLRLKGGTRYRRQLAAVRKMADGSAVRGEASLYRAHDGLILCKMVAWLPRPPQGFRTGVLHVRTAPDSLLIAVDSDAERVWSYHGDHLRRWIAEYDRKRQRLSDDRKAENRPVASFEGHWDTMVRKQRARMKSAVQEIAAQVSGFAVRRRMAKVVYDDRERGFAAQFPYFELAQRIAIKLDEAGIVFEQASGEVEQKESEPLADKEDE